MRSIKKRGSSVVALALVMTLGLQAASVTTAAAGTGRSVALQMAGEPAESSLPKADPTWSVYYAYLMATPHVAEAAQAYANFLAWAYYQLAGSPCGCEPLQGSEKIFDF